MDQRHVPSMPFVEVARVHSWDNAQTEVYYGGRDSEAILYEYPRYPSLPIRNQPYQEHKQDQGNAVPLHEERLPCFVQKAQSIRSRYHRALNCFAATTVDIRLQMVMPSIHPSLYLPPPIIQAYVGKWSSIWDEATFLSIIGFRYLLAPHLLILSVCARHYRYRDGLSSMVCLPPIHTLLAKKNPPFKNVIMYLNVTRVWHRKLLYIWNNLNHHPTHAHTYH